MHANLTSWSLRERLLSFMCGVTANLKTEQDTPAYVYTSTSSARIVGGTRVYPWRSHNERIKQAGQHRYVIQSTYVPRLCAGRPPPLSCLRNLQGFLLPLHSHKKEKKTLRRCGGGGGGFGAPRRCGLAGSVAGSRRRTRCASGR